MMARDRLSGKVQLYLFIYSIYLFLWWTATFPLQRFKCAGFSRLRRCGCCLDATLKVFSKSNAEKAGVLPDCRHTEERDE